MPPAEVADVVVISVGLAHALNELIASSRGDEAHAFGEVGLEPVPQPIVIPSLEQVQKDVEFAAPFLIVQVGRHLFSE